MRMRNILTILLLNYLILNIVSAVVELWYVSDRAQYIQGMMMTAADMALEQTQATDDFFTSGGGYFIEGI